MATPEIIYILCPHCGCGIAEDAGYPNFGCVICCKCSRLFQRNGEPLRKVEYREPALPLGMTIEELRAIY